VSSKARLIVLSAERRGLVTSLPGRAVVFLQLYTCTLGSEIRGFGRVPMAMSCMSNARDSLRMRRRTSLTRAESEAALRSSAPNLSSPARRSNTSLGTMLQVQRYMHISSSKKCLPLPFSEGALRLRSGVRSVPWGRGQLAGAPAMT